MHGLLGVPSDILISCLNPGGPSAGSLFQTQRMLAACESSLLFWSWERDQGLSCFVEAMHDDGYDG